MRTTAAAALAALLSATPAAAETMLSSHSALGAGAFQAWTPAQQFEVAWNDAILNADAALGFGGWDLRLEVRGATLAGPAPVALPVVIDPADVTFTAFLELGWTADVGGASNRTVFVVAPVLLTAFPDDPTKNIGTMTYEEAGLSLSCGRRAGVDAFEPCATISPIASAPGVQPRGLADTLSLEGRLLGLDREINGLLSQIEDLEGSILAQELREKVDALRAEAHELVEGTGIDLKALGSGVLSPGSVRGAIRIDFSGGGAMASGFETFAFGDTLQLTGPIEPSTAVPVPPAGALALAGLAGLGLLRRRGAVSPAA